MVQILTLLVGYGYILYVASEMISEGSELLLLIPSLAGIVGSCVIPILVSRCSGGLPTSAL